MLNILLVAVGGAFGSVMRYLTGVFAGRILGMKFPYGTLTVNILGGLLMGILIGVLALRGGENQERWRIFIGVGVLGGYTTFSSFSLEVARMIEAKAWAQALGYSLGSVVICVSAVFLGMFLMRKLLA
ncbi:fluoride efflux transporter CrcB [Phenylobacterium sp.]|uniref:fluoride efflux transporter CrcB n=1 Tax=Phenylobacterium sp. TaxID=1871053 RepID=UPI00122B259B|nr:fluoride efflux transporter CrcB [Phenylobacterium sp.]THD63579.1 MAG: fluoride efflux transporter CrcB [Phenylobacterium sp.]